jgi:hypothetical protein
MTLTRDYWVSSSEPADWTDRQSCIAHQVSLSVFVDHPARPEVSVAVGPHGRRRPPPE